MNRKLYVFLAVIAIGAALLGSCNNTGEENRSVVVVSNMNAGVPVFSDVLEQGDTIYVHGDPSQGVFTADDFVREDVIPVTFRNRPYNDFVTTGPNQPFSDFLVTHYRVTFRRVDGGATAPPAFEGATSIRVPTGEEVTGGIVIVPFEYKNSPLLAAINYLGAAFPDEILTIARVTFTGHEIGSDREWDFVAEVTVNFADPVVVSKKQQ